MEHSKHSIDGIYIITVTIALGAAKNINNYNIPYDISG